MNLQDIDLQKLTEEQAKDIKEIEQLQKQVEEMAANLTLGDVTNIEDMLAARPSVKKSRSSK
jgi:galactokinase/mevalonate kinase-like predicted kinase|tara:strand:+ start:748 stop:933 length:186 start_codon:yes stop_codon:yes gene_type:complete